MADTDYKRLGCAAEACAGKHKAHGYCIRHYRQWQRGGIKQDVSQCAGCGKPFTPTQADSMYCAKKCKTAAWKKTNPERMKELRAREQSKRPEAMLCAYFAKHCERCGRAGGGRRDWRLCGSCAEYAAAEASRAAYEAIADAQHRAAGKAVACSECAIQFCPLRGYGMTRLCPDCRRDRAKAQKDKRDERIKSQEREPVIRKRVFDRCGWLCQLCGIATPKELRGTYAHNAPELDHIVPVARGGGHTYANTQCLCRSCNGWKAARTMEEVMAALQG